MKRKLLLVLLVFVLTVFLGACSSGSDQEGDVSEEDSSGADTGIVTIEISGFKFNPGEVTIQAGTTVTWTNMEAAPHSAVGDNEEWDSGALRKNDSFSFTFDTPGTYPYHDYYYPAMHGTIIVTE